MDHVTILRNNNLKVTPQRLEILGFLDRNRVHPSIDRIYCQLKMDNPNLSKATVYNVIEDLSRKGVIQVLTINGSSLVCDLNCDPHLHFICKECGSIIDLEGTFDRELLKRVGKEGHDVEETFGYFRGTCRTCIEDHMETGKSK